ncbi:c-type cytochrome [Legionella fairfieldensis]|uniref:c-type cytochrome n=1 Tax=Legionella fairfieldensis TaxID=45064 RepID=UPI00056AE8A6|nr:c-type cytochrome [Legionella fairfieldensis]
MVGCVKYFFISLLIGLPFSFALAQTHRPQEFLDSIRRSKNEGEQIVQHFCANCHALKPVIELGAPKTGQKKDWEIRVKQGLNTLLDHTKEGFNAMPARGGCFECSDEQLLLAILAMLPQAMKNENKDHK